VAHDRGRIKQLFHVLSECPIKLIIGRVLLEKAEILTHNRNLLRDCPAELKNVDSLLWIGSPQKRMKRSIDEHDLTATADTGSDLNFMSLDCANREGFRIERRREAHRRIQLGDGTQTETIGQACIYNPSLDWRKAESMLPDDPSSSYIFDSTFLQATEPSNVSVIFHVLPGLPSDLIPGYDLLDATDTFI
jgi:hypothetical protein